MLAKEFEREGIPTVFVTALPTIAQMVGANRIMRGVAITNPTGDPELAPEDERAMRLALMRRVRDDRRRRRAAHRVGARPVTRRAAVTAASSVLEHVPGLVRYGSKPRREPAKLDALAAALRPFDEAVSYALNQVFIGALEPEDLWTRPRNWWQHPSRPPLPWAPTATS